MDTARWQLVKALFEAASALPPSERADFVSRECNNDTSIAEEVLRLLDVPTESGDALQDEVRRAGRAAADAFEQRELGPYRLLRSIGRGGMGQVFLAERDDAEFEQQVAIKLAHWLGSDDETAIRFKQERQILADLDHPNIARLLDGGRSESGQPYIVMEYIDGESIASFSRRESLTIRHRLDLFIAVCEAVQYAHSQLVIHRDIKPSNVLVTQDGQPKLLDFGIAKLLDDPAQAGLTRADMRPMTPEYASPEQLTGAPVTTATDVYGLGVLLYQILSGELPFDMRSKTSPQIVEMVCKTEPSAPSVAARRAGFRQRASKMVGDLDNIVLMAMHKDPVRRYATVKDLADDIRAYLEKKPVIARGDSWAYRTRKFLQRHQAAALATFAVVLAGTVQTVFYTQQLAKERDIALQEREVAESTTDFLVDLFNVSRPGESRGETITAREVLDEGAARIRSELTEDDRIRARMLQTIGAVYQRLGLYDDAQTLMQEAVTLNRLHRSSEDQLFIDSLDELAWLHYRSENWQAAFEIATESLELQSVANGGKDDPSMARTLNHLGTITYYLDDYDGSLAYYQRALATLNGEQWRNSEDRGTTLNHLGIVYATLSRFDESEVAYRESLDIRIHALGADHPDTATAYANLGAFYANTEQWEKAREVALKALAIDRKTKGEEHVDVAFDLGLLGAIELGLDQPMAALPHLTQAANIWRVTAGPTHSRYARALDRLANTYRQLKRFDEARTHGEKALHILREHYGDAHTLTADAHYTLGTLSYDSQDIDAAVNHFDRALTIRTNAFGENHQEVWKAEHQMARVERASGRSEAALSRIRRVFASIESTNMTDSQVYSWLRQLESELAPAVDKQ
ncbi:MAG: serine/threonine-protein kinase [Pseudomonadota bacterium]